MNFFDEDPFEEIIREFFRESPIRGEKKFIRGENEDRIIDFIEDDDKIYLIFEIPGYNEEDVSVSVVGKNLEISAKKSNKEAIQDYIKQKLKQGILIKKELPLIINKNSMTYHVTNGVLEIIFNKKKRGKNEPRRIKIN